jgi:glutamate racemase
MQSAKADQYVSEDQPAAERPPYPGSIERAVGPEELGAQHDLPVAPYSHLAALCPIGALDSGMGGLSIIAEIRRLLPYEDIIYYGDNGNCPYGGRPDEWLRARVLEIGRFLLDQGAKALVVACNTASAAGLEHLRAQLPLPVVGLVPAVKPAVALTRSRTVGVLATRATNRGRLLADVIDRYATPAGVDVVTTAPDELVSAVERGELDTPATLDAVRRAVDPMLNVGADAIVLGCTHYPFLRDLIRQVAGDDIAIIDSGEGVARQTERVLASRHLLHPPDRPGTLTIYTSGNLEEVRPIVWRLVGEEVEVRSV